MSIEKIGYGAGSRDLDKAPNVLRAVLGVASAVPYPAVLGRSGCRRGDRFEHRRYEPAVVRGRDGTAALAAGLDVFLMPVQMKKNLLGTLLTVLCERNHVDALAELLLTHTTSFGLRVHEAQRRKVAREMAKVKTRSARSR